jgi:hypothetical protein
MRRTVLHVLRTKENAVADLTRLSESDARFSFVSPSDHRYPAFYQCERDCHFSTVRVTQAPGT